MNWGRLGNYLNFFEEWLIDDDVWIMNLRTLTFKDLPKVLTKSALVSSVVLLLVGAAMAFKTVVSLSHAPEILANFIINLTDNPYILLFLINIFLFIVGMFLDAGPAIIILGPILGPVFTDLGVHPVHFAIIMSVNLGSILFDSNTYM